VRPGSSIRLTLLVANPGPAVADDCVISTVPESAGCEPASFSLAPNEERIVECSIILDEPGQTNVLAAVAWKEGGTAARATTELIGQATVAAPGWFERQESFIAGAAVLVAGVILLFRFRRSLFGRHLIFVYAVIVMIGIALLLLALGLFGNDKGVFVLYGSVLVVISTVLAILGEKDAKRLLSRVQKAGPIEFSAAAERIQYYDVVQARERDFKKPSTRVDSVMQAGSALQKYVDLHRLEALSFESRLVRENPPAPGTQTRLDWIRSLPAATTAVLGSELEELERLYKVITGYETFSTLFRTGIHTRMETARTDRTQRTSKVREAIDIINDFRRVTDPDSIPAHCLTILANLHLVIGENEAAFSTLYQAQSIFPRAIVSNHLLAFYLMDLANDSYTALAYEDKALESVREYQKSVTAWHADCAGRIKNMNNNLANHLRSELERYDGHQLEALQGWLDRLRRQIENNVANAIAMSELIYREEDAKRYALAAVESDPNNADYLDTLGLVKLTFGMANRDREEVREALKLFNRAAHQYEQSGSSYERKLIRLHLKRAKSALRSAQEWS
jgi:hypothetical protein